MTAAEHVSDFKKRHPITGELWDVYCEDTGYFLPRHKGTALYVSCIITTKTSLPQLHEYSSLYAQHVFSCPHGTYIGQRQIIQIYIVVLALKTRTFVRDVVMICSVTMLPLTLTFFQTLNIISGVNCSVIIHMDNMQYTPGFTLSIWWYEWYTRVNSVLWNRNLLTDLFVIWF